MWLQPSLAESLNERSNKKKIKQRRKTNENGKQWKELNNQNHMNSILRAASVAWNEKKMARQTNNTIEKRMSKTKNKWIQPPPDESINVRSTTNKNAKAHRKNRKHEKRKERQMHNSKTAKTHKTNMWTQTSQAESLKYRSNIKNNQNNRRHKQTQLNKWNAKNKSKLKTQRTTSNEQTWVQPPPTESLNNQQQIKNTNKYLNNQNKSMNEHKHTKT